MHEKKSAHKNLQRAEKDWTFNALGGVVKRERERERERESNLHAKTRGQLFF